MATEKNEKENLLNKKGSYYDEERGTNNLNESLADVMEEAATIESIDGVKTMIAMLFVVFECVPVIMSGYILNSHYALFFAVLFGISLFAVMCLASEKFHYVLITIFMYGVYLFMLFVIAHDAFKYENTDLYHIDKLKTVTVFWIILQFAIGFTFYYKCCKTSVRDTQQNFEDEQLEDID